jgi:REP-associated tyrosine transposase
VGIHKVSSIIRRVPRDLIRIYGFRDYHYIACSCYQRKPLMGSAYARDVFVEVFDRVRARYYFDVLGYVLMPEHFHFMITEPDRSDPSVVMKALKQTTRLFDCFLVSCSRH